MKQSSKFLLVLLAFSFLLSCERTPQQAISERPIAPIENLTPEKIRDSIVLIESKTESGSGFFVTRDKIATNSHVVAHPGPIHVKSLDEGTVWTIEGVTGFDAANNIVILKLTSEGMPLPLGGSDTARIGEPVSIPGYPDGEYIVTEGSIQSIRNTNKWLRVNTTTSKETNGSPVLNNKGQVIAVIVPYDNGSYSYAIPSSALEALFDKPLPIEPLTEWQQRKHVRAEAYYSLGVERFANEDYAEAIVNFDKAIELNPKYVRAHYERGRTQSYLDDYTSAIATLTQTLTIDPADPDIYYSLGTAKFLLGDYDDAMVDLDKAIELDTQHANTYANRGGAKLRHGESESAGGNVEEAQDLYQAAITDLDKAIELDAQHANAYANRGGAKLAHGDLEAAGGNTKEAQSLYQAAIADYDKAIEIEPENAAVYYNRGSAKLARGDLEAAGGNTKEAQSLYQAAIADYDKVIEIEPENAAVYSNRGSAKSRLAEAEAAGGNVEEAQDLYQAAIADHDKAIEIDPEKTAAYINRGSAKFGLAEATHGYSSVEDLEEQSLLALGLFNSEDADTDSKRETELRLRELEAKRVAERVNLYEAAIADYDTAIQINPENTEVYNYRGYARFHFGTFLYSPGHAEKVKKLYKAAIEDYTRVIQVNPENADVYFRRGIAKCKLGDFESEFGDAEIVQSLYHEGITDYDRFIQLNNPEDAYEETADLLSEKVTNSIVRVVSWDDDGFSNGSGFFVEKDKIATNIHVVAKTGPLFITLRNEKTIWKVEEVTAFDVENDLVILKIAREGIPLSLGDSVTVQGGEPVVAVGYPNSGYKVTAGVIDRNDSKLIRMKVGVSGGSSGGPALNSAEQVIGIHVSSGKYYAYAIPSNVLKALIVQSGSTEPLVEWHNRDPIRAYAYLSQGWQELKSNRYYEAATEFSSSIRHNPAFSKAYHSRGNAYANLGNYDKAIADYSTAIRLNPNDVRDYVNRGNVRFYLGKSESSRGNAEEAEKLYEAAVADCTETLKLDPENAEAYYWRGRAKEALGQADLEKAKALNPKVGQ